MAKSRRCRCFANLEIALNTPAVYVLQSLRLTKCCQTPILHLLSHIRRHIHLAWTSWPRSYWSNVQICSCFWHRNQLPRSGRSFPRTPRPSTDSNLTPAPTSGYQTSFYGRSMDFQYISRQPTYCPFLSSYAQSSGRTTGKLRCLGRGTFGRVWRSTGFGHRLVKTAGIWLSFCPGRFGNTLGFRQFWSIAILKFCTTFSKLRLSFSSHSKGHFS